mmetsp:Transcript_27794/g.70863  ORF Transcript_27794/g.70863 Transcript_27794/m.70863 type:complete len:249 (-) Transcript_27794:314-1060(-)
MYRGCGAPHARLEPWLVAWDELEGDCRARGDSAVSDRSDVSCRPTPPCACPGLGRAGVRLASELVLVPPPIAPACALAPPWEKPAPWVPPRVLPAPSCSDVVADMGTMEVNSDDTRVPLSMRSAISMSMVCASPTPGPPSCCAATAARSPMPSGLGPMPPPSNDRCCPAICAAPKPGKFMPGVPAAICDVLKPAGAMKDASTAGPVPVPAMPPPYAASLPMGPTTPAGVCASGADMRREVRNSFCWRT